MRTRFIHIIHWLIRLVARVFFGLRETGRGNIPRTGAVIVAANHISDWDPPVLGMASSRVPFYMAKSELFRNPLAAFLLRKLGAFPVNRDGLDTAAIRTSLSILAQGNILAMFPEGTRNRRGRQGRAKQGIALIARRSGAPIVPAYISGTMRPLSGFQVVFGPPVAPGEIGAVHASGGYAALSDLIMERIADTGRRAGTFTGYDDLIPDSDKEATVNEREHS